jgi:hypothetical protein
VLCRACHCDAPRRGKHPSASAGWLSTHITLLDRLAAEFEDEIGAALGAIPAAWGVTADGVPSPDPGPGAAVLPAAERLAEIPGVSLKLAREIIAATGLDMARFPTADHLVSWAGLAPVARQSGSRQRKPSTGQRGRSVRHAPSGSRSARRDRSSGRTTPEATGRGACTATKSRL